MSVTEAQLLRLIADAPRSEQHLYRLLREGLNWPFPHAMAWDEIYWEWAPEELHLDPDRVARLKHIRQLAPISAAQTTGVFILEFDKGNLPIGAIRRVVNQLVRKKRATANASTHPTWALHDLVFFCLSTGHLRVLHVVAFREDEGRRVLRVLRWTEEVTPGRLDLLLHRAVPDLSWKRVGPAISVDRDVFAGHREGIRSAAALSKRMAEVAQEVRDEVKSLYEVETDEGPIRKLYTEVQQHLLADLTPERFADVYAQTMVYGLLTARIAHPEQFQADQPILAMRFENQFLDAIYARFRDESEDVIDVDELGLSELAEELAATDVDELLADFGTDNQRDDPVVYFYETFLTDYDPEQRRNLGAFYTPIPVVRYIVKTVDDALKSFGLPLGVANTTTWGEYLAAHPGVTIPPGCAPGDAVVSMLEPAGGTGTFLVEWLRRGKANAGEAGLGSALAHAAALEISLASYAVSHLKVSLELPDELREQARLPIYLADTLAPRRPQVFEELEDPVSVEGRLAEEVKFGHNHNVIVGNPPYDRDASALGGFILAPQSDGRSLFDDILDDAKKHVIFSYTKSLNDLYVYFWRWAIWKVFEENTGPAVISMITSSSWLAGPGFLGLRRLVREVADEIAVLDLGGAGRGARTEENVFDIQTPVAIVTLVRRGAIDRTLPATARYARIPGSRQEKLKGLTDFTVGTVQVSWIGLDDEWYSPLSPPAGGADWQGFPAVAHLLPWQQPGCQFGRTSPVSPSADTLKRRWTRFVSTPDTDDRAKCFAASSTGRNVFTRVAGYRRLAEEPVGAAPQPIVRYGYRSFDRQWAFDDPRWAKTESPSLWWSATSRQIFMTAMMTNKMGDGPAATITTGVPDFHHFCGRGGKDVIPLYRDAAGTPNVDPALLAALTAVHRAGDSASDRVTVERLFAYVFGILAGAAYTARFHEELDTPGPRVPLTADPALFAAMATHGEHLLWLQTFGERFADGRGDLTLDGIAWKREPTGLPADRNAFGYDSATESIRVADGLLTGVPKDVWDFEVSGMQVIPKWLGYRRATPAGRAASSSSPLDKIRPTEWSPEWSTELVEIVGVLRETLALQPAGVEILEQILAGPLIAADELPPVPPALRQPPATRETDGDLLSHFEADE